MNPRVSILIPAYNDEKYIKFAIESVLQQSFKKWELVIVDDCSEDHTYEIAKSYINNKNELIVTDISDHQ